MKTFWLSSLAIVCAFCGFSQDAYFVNTHQSLVYLNSSFAGSNGFIRNQTSYRDQWPSLSGSYVTALNTVDGYIAPIKGGVSVSLLQDIIGGGAIRTGAVSMAYAQHLSVSDKLKVIPSLEAVYGQKSLDLSRLSFAELSALYNGQPPIWGVNETSFIQKAYLDLNSGLLLNYKNLFVGASLKHFNRPDVGLFGISKLPTRTNIHASYNFNLSSRAQLNVVAVAMFQSRSAYSQLQLNGLLFKHWLIGGGYKSHGYSAHTGFRHDYFTLMIGYDATTSILGGYSVPSWEAHASFNLRKKAQRNELCFEKW